MSDTFRLLIRFLEWALLKNKPKLATGLLPPSPLDAAARDAETTVERLAEAWWRRGIGYLSPPTAEQRRRRSPCPGSPAFGGPRRDVPPTGSMAFQGTGWMGFSASGQSRSR